MSKQKIAPLQIRGNRDASSGTEHFGYPAQELILDKRPVGSWERVSLSDPVLILRTLRQTHNTMSAQPAVAPDHRYVADLNLIRADALDYQRISRPNRWQHAPACCGKPESSVGAQNLGRKFAFCGEDIRRSTDTLRHEDFGGCKVPQIKPETLEQVRADVTKTSS